ncbi:MAG: hypothetical protein QXF32_03830 [Candidatus Thermoplasmatota archaeon]
MDYAVVSAKIPKELKKKLEEYDIKVSKLIRKAISEEIRKIEMKKMEKEINNLRKIIKKINSEEITKSIREDREA